MRTEKEIRKRLIEAKSEQAKNYMQAAKLLTLIDTLEWVLGDEVDFLKRL